MNWPDLDPQETLVAPDAEEFLWRNCAEGWLDGGEPTKQLFIPYPKDDDQVSSALRSKVSAADHFDEFVALGNQSVGVWATTPAEVDEVGLRAVDDSATGQSALTGHAYIDFRACTSGGQRQRAARKLKDFAKERGPQHP